MAHIGGGIFEMGSDNFYPDEAPRRKVCVDPFLIDRHPVTNADFRAFVEGTGHITLAEQAPDTFAYPDADPTLLKPGSSVFTPPRGVTPHQNPFAWWTYVVGASWRQPLGPGSTIDGLDDHPVVHVSYGDALAYARWTGKRLPTEAEWECAAWGGKTGTEYSWGDVLEPQGTVLANYWRGPFPWHSGVTRDQIRTSPMGRYPPNGFGLCDMIGNVWEWTSDWYAPARSPSGPSCCIPQNPRGGTETGSRSQIAAEASFGRKVLKGGSHLCAESYCQRYRPAARYPQTVDTSTSHIGFRCAADADAPPK
jgi:formylglycine-generating enzyme